MKLTEHLQHSPRRFSRMVSTASTFAAASAPLHHIRLPQVQSNQRVQYRNEDHRDDEEEERGQFERMLDQNSLHGTHHHLWIAVMVDNSDLQRQWQCDQQTH